MEDTTAGKPTKIKKKKIKEYYLKRWETDKSEKRLLLKNLRFTIQKDLLILVRLPFFRK